MKTSGKQWIVFAVLFIFSLGCYTFLSTRKPEAVVFSNGLNIENAEKIAEQERANTGRNLLFHVELFKKIARGARKLLPASHF
jgi:hypothetical protein